MDISPPVLQNVSFLGQFPNLRGLITELWEISVLRPDDVVWCVILAYLKSFPNVTNQEFNSNLKVLGNSKVGENIKTRLKHYNPFLSRNAGLYDEVVKDLITPFREKIDSSILQQETVLVSNSTSKELQQRLILLLRDYSFKVLQASAILLSRDIALISYQEKMVYQFPAYGKNLQLNLDSCLFLFRTLVDDGNKFSISLRKNQGLAMQKSALREILRGIIKNKKHIKAICSLPDINDNFLIALMRSGHGNIILTLFKSTYVLTKLFAAGFKIDPRTEDNRGNNALYYSLFFEKTYLLYFLYDFAANACFRTGNSIRSPNPLIVENLMLMKECITKLKETVESNKNTDKYTDRHFARIDELLRFNIFQTEICQHMNKMRQEIVYYNSSEVCHEVLQRKNIILGILKTYENYFHWHDSSIHTSEKLARFKESLNHPDYYDNLDFRCAVLFFDNLFLLKEKLKVENNLYLKIESNFLLNLFCIRYFRKCEDIQQSDSLAYRMIIFQKRNDLLKKIRHFRESVEKTKICKENLLNCVPEDEVETLTNLPEIYDEFFLYRIEMYLNIATSTTVKDRKSILVIERALQVIGESVTDRLEIESLQNVITFGLPSELVTDLKRIRNQLSHLQPDHYPWRFSVKDNMELFESIKSELKVLSNILQPVYITHEYRMQRYISLLALKAFNRAAKGKVSEEYISYFKAIFQSLNDTDDYDNDKESCNLQRQWREYFNSVYLSAQQDLILPNYVLMKGSTKKYKYILNNMFLSVKRKLNEIRLKKSDINSCKNSLNECLLPIECILHFITTDDFIICFRRDFLKKFKARRSFCKIEKKKKIQNGSENASISEGSHDPEILNLITKAEAILMDYENISEKIFQNAYHIVKEDLVHSFPSIHKLRKMLFGKAYLNKREKQQIRRDVTSSNIAVKKLKNTIYEKKLTSEEVNIELSKLRFKEKEWEELCEDYETDPTNFLARIEPVSDILVELEHVMEQNEMDGKQYSKFCDKLDLSEESKEILIKIVKGYKKKNPGDQLEFLSNRIKLLKLILIEENKDIIILWDKMKNRRSKDCTQLREKVLHLYLNDPEVRLSVETLLFDCMNILKNEKLRDLLRKSSNLFNGIDLRNVLAHGNPLLELLGIILHPDDLPSELVNKILHLVLDDEIIDIMLRIRNETKADYSKFLSIMDDKSSKYNDLCEQIRDCESWKDYARL